MYVYDERVETDSTYFPYILRVRWIMYSWVIGPEAVCMERRVFPERKGAVDPSSCFILMDASRRSDIPEMHSTWQKDKPGWCGGRRLIPPEERRQSVSQSGVSVVGGFYLTACHQRAFGRPAPGQSFATDSYMRTRVIPEAEDYTTTGREMFVVVRDGSRLSSALSHSRSEHS